MIFDGCFNSLLASVTRVANSRHNNRKTGPRLSIMPVKKLHFFNNRVIPVSRMSDKSFVRSDRSCFTGFMGSRGELEKSTLSSRYIRSKCYFPGYKITSIAS